GTISTDYKREMESSEVKRARALLESKIKELCGTFGLRGIKLGSYKDTQASRFDDGGKTLYINANRIYAASLSDQRICSEIEEAVIQAVAKKELLLKYKDSKALEEFENLLTLTRTRLMTNTKTFSELMKEGEKKSLEKRALNEYRLYTDKEMEALRGVPYLITRRLIKSGALREIKPEKFLAKDFSECIKQMKGYTPVYEILRQIVTANVEEDITDREASLAITATEQSVVRQLANAELPEYIKDLGKGSQNFFIIRNDSIENFKKLVSSESLYKRQVSRKSSVRICTDNEESLDTSVDEAEPKKIECGWSKNNPLSFDPTKDGYKRGMFITTDRGVGKIVMEHPGNKIEVKYPGLDKTVLYKFNVE
ncbi:hypothetical protein KY308_02390, partial [Candidatus Woesearchaeota archaeon]|nr:hypothetical protein [Candidatus Woesearchaeota archaeon]